MGTYSGDGVLHLDCENIVFSIFVI